MNDHLKHLVYRLGRGKQLERAITATKTLQAKGVEVIFVQMPYEGHYAISEIDITPRELTYIKSVRIKF